jgi:hypothetical protein
MKLKHEDLFSLADGSEELEKLLIEETDFYKVYAVEINGLIFKRHIAKMDEKTGLPKYLANQRIRFGTSPVKGAFIKVEDGK